MKDKLITCSHCHRKNWHEEKKCRWCFRKLPKTPPQWIVLATVLVALSALASTVYVGMQL